MFRGDVGLDGAMFRASCNIGDFEGSRGVENAKERPAETMTEQRRAVMEAALGVMNSMVDVARGPAPWAADSDGPALQNEFDCGRRRTAIRRHYFVRKKHQTKMLGDKSALVPPHVSVEVHAVVRSVSMCYCRSPQSTFLLSWDSRGPHRWMSTTIEE